MNNQLLVHDKAKTMTREVWGNNFSGCQNQLDDGIDFIFECHPARVETEVGVHGGFEGGADAREVLYLSATGTGIEAFHVAALALAQRRGNIDLAEVFRADDFASHLSQLFRGRNKTGYRDDARIDEELAYLGNAADVLAAVFG